MWVKSLGPVAAEWISFMMPTLHDDKQDGNLTYSLTERGNADEVSLKEVSLFYFRSKLYICFHLQT